MPAELKLEILMRAKDEATAAIKRLGGAFESLGKVARTIRRHWLAVSAAVGSLVYSMSRAIKAAMEQEEAEMRLRTALETAGIYTEKVYRHSLDYAASLQRMTAFGDEAIIMLQALLFQMGLQPREMERAVKLSLDWATVFRKDLQAAALDVGKALSGNIMMLQRYGVEISKAEVQTRGASAVLDALERTVGGAAEAIGVTLVGRMARARHAFGDLLEAIGRVITGYKGTSDILVLLAESLEKATSFIDEHSGTIRKLVIGPILSLVKGIGALISEYLLWREAIIRTEISVLELTYSLHGNWERILKLRMELSELREQQDFIIDVMIDVESAFEALNKATEESTTVSHRLSGTLLKLRERASEMSESLTSAKDGALKLVSGIDLVDKILKDVGLSLTENEDRIRRLYLAQAKLAKAHIDGRITAEEYKRGFEVISEAIRELENAELSRVMRVEEFQDRITEAYRRGREEVLIGQLEWQETLLRMDEEFLNEQLQRREEAQRKMVDTAQYYGSFITEAWMGAWSDMLAGERSFLESFKILLLRGLGDLLMTEGTKYFFMGWGRILASWGLDPTGYALVALGTTMMTLGAALGGVAAGMARPAGGGVGAGGARMPTPAAPVREERPTEITVVVQTGQVFATEYEVGRAVINALKEARRFGVVI